MIRRLQRQFVVVAMAAIFVVLAVIMGVINLLGYLDVGWRADQLLAILSENGGTFPKPDHKKEGREPRPFNLGPETPYETRHFSVLLSPQKTATTVNTGAIAAISSAQAVDYAQQVCQKDAARGFTDNYRFLQTPSGENTLVLFLDCSKDFSTLRSFFFTCLLVSAGGLLAVFLLVLVLSKFALRPVADSYRRQKQFITDASHEIKTPLAIIGANTEVLELESGENTWTKSTREQIDRLTRLTGSLVSLTRMDEGAHSLAMTDFSLSDAAAETADQFLPLAQSGDKSFSMDICKDLSYTGNEEALRRMLGILLDNAFKYSNPGGSIRLSLTRAGKRPQLQVWNTVEYIERGDQSQLFERFYRRDSARSAGGFGVGLSIAKAAAEIHRGRISAKSPDGKSLLVTVTL